MPFQLLAENWSSSSYQCLNFERYALIQLSNLSAEYNNSYKLKHMPKIIIILTGTIWEAFQLGDGGWVCGWTLPQHMMLRGRIHRVGTVTQETRALPHFDAK
jgi:hypothetical protein